MHYKKINGKTACIVDMERMRIYDFFETLNNARISCTKLNAEESTNYSILRYGQFLKLEKASILKPATKITKEKFWEMLEILPPLNWIQNGEYESFCMSEFWTSSYTQSYGRCDDEYIEKMVDYSDSSTFICYQDFLDTRHD